jgi:hypothetical protein
MTNERFFHWLRSALDLDEDSAWSTILGVKPEDVASWRKGEKAPKVSALWSIVFLLRQWAKGNQAFVPAERATEIIEEYDNMADEDIPPIYRNLSESLMKYRVVTLENVTLLYAWQRMQLAVQTLPGYHQERILTEAIKMSNEVILGGWKNED